MKSKMLGALALLTLIGALFVIQSADQYTPTADAAAGSIAALNVGTCLTTSEAIFGDEGCALSGDGSGDDPVKWEVRKDVTEVSTLYATYAHDPKTSSDAPRAILMNSDLLKISITDTDRDKRSGVLIRGATNTVSLGTDDSGLGKVIRDDLTKDDLDFDTYDPFPSNDPTDGTTTDDDDDVIKFTSEDAADRTDGIWLYHRATSTSATVLDSSLILTSGNKTLNFSRSGRDDLPTVTDRTTNAATDPQWQFDPGDFKVDDGAEVRFYGCVNDPNVTAGCNNDNADNNAATPVTDPFKRLTELEVDEDASNGEASGDIAPWLGVNASVPNNKNVIILAIYYRTSDQENLVGGNTYRVCSDGTSSPSESNDVWSCPGNADVVENDGPGKETHVDYTSDEIDDNSPLLVQAVADGNLNDRSVNLYLTETKRFNGVYQGYLRLTDANGDGSINGDSGNGPDNWGRMVRNGQAPTVDGDGNVTDNGAAVLAVQSGPVTIEYRDSDGSKRTLDIEIDIAAPRISVTSPAHGASSGDQSPDFAGTLEDTDSGLADKSFRLVADNRIDGQGTNDDFVLDNAPNADSVRGPADAALTRIEDYTGYNTTAPPSQFGIVPSASRLYDLGDDSCDNQDQCHILADEYDDGATSGTFDDDLRLDLQDSSGDVDTRDREFQIDFQAFVMDMAGNIGFSDSDPSNPRYINDLGEKDSTKRKAGNVLGYYSAHVITLDEKDPVIQNAQTATGYFGLNSDGDPVADRSGVMVVFDGPITASSVSTSTFSVELDDGTAASIVDARVEKHYAFLKLASELASDATPEIDIMQGEKVEDMAGNETFGREVDAFEANDGISPRLTVTLSGGSGTGTGNEGPDKLTNDQITVNVSSDEELQGAPKIYVVCSSLRWNEGENADVKKDIDDFVANRNTSSAGDPGEAPATTAAVSGKNVEYQYTCDYKDADGVVQDFGIGSPATGLSRPGDNWDHTWKKGSVLEDGMLTVVVYGNDRSRFEFGGATNVRNWGSASAEFAFDDTDPEIFDRQPEADGVSKEDRPFVLIEFNDSHTVTLDSVLLDGVEIASQFEIPQANRFVYWPQSLARGEHEVEVEASDAAGNDTAFEYSFTVEARGKFLLELQAGWNAVSVPATPVDTAIGSVFTDPAITTVIGWDTQSWRIAVRRDGVWESNQQYAPLNDIQAKYGYWVKSDKFIDQPVALKGPISRSQGGQPTLIGIDTIAGWNFVGVIDQDGDQTESNAFGETLMADNKPVSAAEYLRSDYIRAYTWDPTFSRFDNIAKDDTMTIGQGVWVYYEGGIAP